MIGYLQGTGVSRFMNPVGTPVQVWNGVPVMSQAVSGQEFNSYIYSFIAKATLTQAAQFYAARVAALGIPNQPAPGSSGSGSLATHDITFYSFNLVIYPASRFG